MTPAVIRDLRDARAVTSAEDLDAFETDVLAGFVLARAAAGLSDGTISSDVIHLEQVRAWLGRPLWEMEPADADAYFGKVLRGAASGKTGSQRQADPRPQPRQDENDVTSGTAAISRRYGAAPATPRTDP